MRRTVFALIALLLAACVRGDGITTDRRDAVRSVAIVTVIEDRVDIVSPGVLVFFNEDMVLPMPDWHIDAQAATILTGRLRQMRPDLRIVVPDVDRASLGAIHEEDNGLLPYADPARVADKLAAIGRRAGVDVLLVVARNEVKVGPMWAEGPGLLLYRSIFNDRIGGSVFAFLHMFVVDARNMETIASLRITRQEDRHISSIFVPKPPFQFADPFQGPLSDSDRAIMLEEVDEVLTTALLEGLDESGLYTPPPKPQS